MRVFALITGAFHVVETSFEFGWPFMVIEGNEMARNFSQINSLSPANYTELDTKYSNFTMQLWTNFAKYGYEVYFISKEVSKM